MASEPIPEPLTNQDGKSEAEATSPRSSRPGPELVDPAALPTPIERELPRAARQEEWKDAVQQKLQGVKETASRAKETASQALEEAKEQAVVAVSETKERAAELYQQSREKTTDALKRARSRASYIVNEHPLHVVAGVAALAFVAGILLRVWRSSRDA
jgi:ElaB/YqjD/DUF883 family membrane-anchored ribosome-binding protein